MFDVVVVGARAAGAATAMLLARRGRRVLAVDRARFPSDTLSTHQIQPAGTALLAEWGLLRRILDAGTPATGRVRFDLGRTVIDEPFSAGMLCSPRRTVLDAILVDAAREAGAEIREGFHVAGLLRDDTGRVTGIRGRDGTTITAGLVVGADGKHSLVARSAGAAVHRQTPAKTLASYSYWEGADVPRGEVFQRPGRAVAAFPTNSGLTMVYAAAPATRFEHWRADASANLLDTLDLCGDLGERVRAGRRVERLRTTNDLPNIVRAAAGPGWALVGDARVVMDPVTAQGIGNAFADAAALADSRPARSRRAVFDLTLAAAELRPPGRLGALVLRRLPDILAGNTPVPWLYRALG